jgi:ribulose-phosphate 3-epimerase
MIKSIRIIPAILTENPYSLKTMFRQSASFTDYVQLDVMDGQFVPSRSISREQVSGIPAGLKWEVHLMVQQPENQLEYFQNAGARKAIFHFEATSRSEEVIRAARKLKLKVGLAVNPETAVTSILSLVDRVDSVLFLAVHPGFYGAKFIPEVLEKIAELRKALPGLAIGIDGGIKESNIAQISRSGVSEICVGSAIFLQPDPGAAYRKLLGLANEGTGTGN